MPQQPRLHEQVANDNHNHIQREPRENHLMLKIKRALERQDIDNHLKTIESMVSSEHSPLKIAAALLSLVSEKQASFSESQAPRSHKSFNGGFRRSRRSFDR